MQNLGNRRVLSSQLRSENLRRAPRLLAAFTMEAERPLASAAKTIPATVAIIRAALEPACVTIPTRVASTPAVKTLPMPIAILPAGGHVAEHPREATVAMASWLAVDEAANAVAAAVCLTSRRAVASGNGAATTPAPILRRSELQSHGDCLIVRGSASSFRLCSGKLVGFGLC
jgi:hypothetical protein